jgi:hypothetical protein
VSKTKIIAFKLLTVQQRQVKRKVRIIIESHVTLHSELLESKGRPVDSREKIAIEEQLVASGHTAYL